MPKSKGGPHFAKYNLAPSCLACNASKSNLGLFEWWRPQQFWTEQREEILMAWIHAHSFVSAHTAQGEWEQWMEESQRVVPIYEQAVAPIYEKAKEKAALVWPPSLQLKLAG
jgi:hypothetical protein